MDDIDHKEAERLANRWEFEFKRAESLQEERDALRAEVEAAKQIAENFKRHFTATGGSSVGSKCEWEWNYEGAMADCHHYEEVIASLKERAEAAEARVRELEALEAQCAIEPGQESTYDVPASVAKAMWRFWFRLAKIRGARIAELEAHFPRTADGVAVTPGMVLELLRDKAAEVRDGE